VGAPAGVYDLSGNVREWINACDGTTSNNDNCQIMSGDYGNQPNGERCDMFDHVHRDESGQDWIGFRCCWGK
jgi:formylglycine-generating enzyme